MPDSSFWSYLSSLWAPPTAVAPTPVVPQAPMPDPWAHVPQQYRDIAREAAEREGIPYGLVMRIMQQESQFKPTAVSRKGARGLMQLTPATAKALGVTDPHDPEQSIRGGTAYLRQLYDRFKNYDQTVAAYNAGPTAVRRAKGVPNFPETQAYVQKVLHPPRAINRRKGR